jgi:serine/threonine protein kinase
LNIHIFNLSNILLKNNKPKIADFGTSKEIGSKLCSNQGTPGYQSPEMLARLEYKCKTDIWSAGCVIFETLFLKKYSSIDTNFNEKISGNLSTLIK